MLSAASSLPLIEGTVGVHFTLEPTQKGRPGRSRVRGGVRDPGVQGVGGQAGPERPPAGGGRLLGGPRLLARRA